MSDSTAIADVTELLQGYADRGIFRRFQVLRKGPAAAAYRFVWLKDAVFTLRIDVNSGVVRFADVLPAIDYRSYMDRQLRAFLKDRTSGNVPEHRRVGHDLGELKCTNTNGSISIQLRVKDDQWERATRAAVNLVGDVFHNFLSGPYHEYLVKHFQTPEE